MGESILETRNWKPLVRVQGLETGVNPNFEFPISNFSCMKISPGLYEHYKGNRYQVIGTAIHTETREELVVYTSLYDAPGFPTGSLWVRPKKMFEEEVEVDGKKVPRFRKIEE